MQAMNNPNKPLFIALGCIGVGCVLPVLLVISLFGWAFVWSIGQSPGIERTATGITVTNRADHDILDINITLHAQNVTTPTIAGDFSPFVPSVPAGKSESFPYSSFLSKTGNGLDPTKFEVDHFSLTYHPGSGGTGSESGTI
jgi:hypothetical protein